jgi:hypothetical protein
VASSSNLGGTLLLAVLLVATSVPTRAIDADTRGGAGSTG